ncbi:MAG: GNAT family N-acetyltransferase [Clostridia bacterium]|nr:GNAT family N-acetyltransferase [Clostridia bacterium]
MKSIEIEKILNGDPIKYSNIIGRTINQTLDVSWYVKEDFFVMEQGGFIVPSDESPEKFIHHFEEYCKSDVKHTEFNFAGVPRRQFDLLTTKYKEEWSEFCWLYYYDGEPYANIEDHYSFDEAIYEIDCLNFDDLDMVFENYAFKDDGIGYIEGIIKNETTFCARLCGEAVSWVVQREDGSMGIMYTLEGHRRRGVGEWLCKHLINSILKKNQLPYLHIWIENAPSIALAESLGFKRHSEVVWFGIKNRYLESRRGAVLSEDQLSTLFDRHLEAMDEKLKSMINQDFNHLSIHDYRESIRRFRALLFFFMPFMRPGDYRFFDTHSKRYFDKTSMIREIDVFEHGYGDIMNDSVLKRLSVLKQPLRARLILDAKRMSTFRFSSTKVKLMHAENKQKPGCDWGRQCELFRKFIEKDDQLLGYEEKYIHSKRMLAKKMKYVHEILMPDHVELQNINNKLEVFQSHAKLLHDTCVNLRFVGKYELDDEPLIVKLIEDHAYYSKASDEAYLEVCKAMSEYMDEKK